MAGTIQRAGGEIIRRSTAAGLGGLAIALLVGVMSFALTTRPAGQQQESVARYLTMPARMVELGSASAERTTQSVADLLPGGESLPSVADSVNARPLEASFASVFVPDGGAPRALQAERVSMAEDGAATAVVEAPPPPAEAAAVSVAPPAPPAPSEPALVPGDRVTATVSFYYCEVGPKGRHQGDGGNFCGAMRDGSIVYPGAAACAYTYLGQRFRIIGDPIDRVYTCADTGSAVHGLHRDIWFMSSDDGWEWQLELGQSATIEILP